MTIHQANSMTAQELYSACEDLFEKALPTGMRMIPQPAPIQGRGFFPVTSGCFHDSDLNVFIRRKLMFVGQDWGCEENLNALRADRDADITEGTGKKLLDLVNEAGIPLEECFFTNALFGVRSSKKNTGRSEGWKDKDFVRRCQDALQMQINAVQPRVLISLGRHAPDLLEQIIPACSSWRKAGSFRAIDENKCGLIKIEPAARDVVALAILVHPSFRHVNAKLRKFGDKAGHEAEVLLLKSLWESVK